MAESKGFIRIVSVIRTINVILKDLFQPTFSTGYPKIYTLDKLLTINILWEL